MKILVTGADGFLGSHVAEELLKRGHEVRAFLEKGRNTGALDGFEVEPLYGNLLDAKDVREAVEGCGAALHTAANTSLWPPRSRAVRAVNYDAVVNLAESVLEAGLGALVHIGTANSFAPGTKDRPGTEENPFTDYRYGLDYIDSKRKAQDYLIDLHRTRGLPVKVINPTFMIGPRDTKPGSGQMMISLYRGKVPGYSVGGKNYVYVKDVAAAAVNALSKGRAGECYLAGNSNLSYREAFSLMAEVMGVDPPRMRIPPAAAVGFGTLSSFFGRLTGKPPLVSLPMARLGNAGCYYDAAKAVSELEMPQTPVRRAMEEAFEWFREHGYLSDKSNDEREEGSE